MDDSCVVRILIMTIDIEGNKRADHTPYTIYRSNRTS